MVSFLVITGREIAPTPASLQLAKTQEESAGVKRATQGISIDTDMGNEAKKAGTVAHLPDDTIADILLRLSPTSAIRSGAVCKAWRRVTTDPHFIAAHARRRATSVSVILQTNVDGTPWPGRSVPYEAEEDITLHAFPISSPDLALRLRRQERKA